MKHLHHVVMAFTSREGDRINDFVELNLTDCKTESDALRCAKKILKRPHYRLAKVFECKRCGIEQEQSSLLKQLIREMKK